MIKDLIKIQIPPVTSELAFNILLHITILFIILSIFFMYYISKISSTIINDEIKHLIEDSFNKLSKNISDAKNNSNNKFYVATNYDQIKIIKEQLTNKLKKENIDIPYDYYIKLLSEEDILRKNINNEVFFYIKFTMTLLSLMLFLFTFYLISTKSINMNHFKEICIENVLTFILVGIIELLFFSFIAIKYIPIEPSLLMTSFIDSLTK